MQIIIHQLYGAKMSIYARIYTIFIIRYIDDRVDDENVYSERFRLNIRQHVQQT